LERDGGSRLVRALLGTGTGQPVVKTTGGEGRSL
jgi:hypothetical protein